jgi:hypothetical protein
MTPDGLGKIVPAKTNYDDWLKAQSVDTQIEHLGPTRHRLWKENKLSSRDLVNQRAQPLTIEQLEEKLQLKDIVYKKSSIK